MLAEAALTRFMLEVIKELVRKCMNKKSRARPELEKLHNKLNLLESFVKDLANISQKTEVFKEVEMQIRELVYDVEDVIETCFTKKAAAMTKSFLPRRYKSMRIGMAGRVKRLRKERVEPILQLITPQLDQIKSDGGSTVNKVGMGLRTKRKYYDKDWKHIFTRARIIL